MRKKKFAALLLALSMCLGMLSSCGNNANETSGGNADTKESTDTTAGDQTEASGELENIVFAFFTTKTAPEGIQMVEDEINKIIESKIGVHVTFETYAMSSYSQSLGLMMSGGEQVDIFGIIGTFSEMLAKNQLMNMDPYLNTYGAGAKEALGEDFLKATSKGGSVYALPTLNGKAAVMNIVLREDLIEECGLDLSGLKEAATMEEYWANMDILGDAFAKIKEAHPEMVCLAPTTGTVNSLFFNTQLPFTDTLNDGYGVLTEETGTQVINLYDTDNFRTGLMYAFEWYQKGYVLQDAATTQEAQNTYIGSGRAAAFFIVGEEGQAEQITAATGVPVVAIKLVKPYLATASVNGLGFGIASTSEYPEAAMKFLNEMYTNPDIVNLLDWGVEGVHYEVQEDGTVDFPEGVTADNTSYGLNMDWFFGNQFLSYIWGKGRDITIYERLNANNRSAEFSPANGFSYDSTGVRNEMTAVANVIAEYLPGLATGTLNPDQELKNFNDALESAGLPKIIEDKQRQLDQWLEDNQ